MMTMAGAKHFTGPVPKRVRWYYGPCWYEGYGSRQLSVSWSPVKGRLTEGDLRYRHSIAFRWRIPHFRVEVR